MTERERHKGPVETSGESLDPDRAQPLEVDETAMFEDDQLVPGAERSSYMPGDSFGRYRIQRTLGEGTMGSVFLAQDTQLNRKVALKIPKLSQEDSQFLTRFLREARAAATLSHPNICPIYDVAEEEGTHFLTMAYIQGHPLSDFVSADKPQRERNLANVVRKIALALHEAHINGLVHRDVKPANIMVDQRNEPIVMDFGLARQIGDAGEDARLTRDGAILGSPAYMSPEQIEGKADKIGPSCDIYSLGVILYELLTGQLPFQGSIASIIGQILSREPPAPTEVRSTISSRLSKITMKAMSKDPENRYGSMKEFANALMDFLKSAGENAEKGSLEKSSAPTKKKAGSDTNAGLRLSPRPIEIKCRCGQKLVAQRHLAGKMVKCPRCSEFSLLPGGNQRPPKMPVACKSCGQQFLAGPELIGKAVKCSTCGSPMVIQPRGKAAAPSKINVTCSCGQQFLANADLAGKRVRCPSCRQPFLIPGM